MPFRPISLLNPWLLLPLVSSCAVESTPSADRGSETTSAGGAPNAGASGSSSGTAGAGGGHGGITSEAGGAGAAGAGGTVGGSSGASDGRAGSSETGGAGSGPIGSSGAAGSAGAPPQAGANHVPADYKGKPFQGNVQRIPGKVLVGLYDTGGEGVAFHGTFHLGPFDLCGLKRQDGAHLDCDTARLGRDKDLATCKEASTAGPPFDPKGLVYTSYTDTGTEWFMYTVDVTEAGTYSISTFMGGTRKVGTSLKILLAPSPEVVIPIAQTPTDDEKRCGFEAYHLWKVNPDVGKVTLEAGRYVLKMTAAAASNIHWLEFKKQ